MLFERWDIKPDLIIQKNIEPIARKIKDFLKEFYETSNVARRRYIMLNDYRIMDTPKYYTDYIILGKKDPRNALVYIFMTFTSSNIEFHFPFIYYYELIIDVYLSKQGFYYYHHYEDRAVPATGLKYVTISRYMRGKAIMEIFDVNEITMPRIFKEAKEALADKSKKHLKDNDYNVFLQLFKSQKILAGHDIREAYNILDYYNKEDEAERIISEYNKIFSPIIKLCYDVESWDKIDCPTFSTVIL